MVTLDNIHQNKINEMKTIDVENYCKILEEKKDKGMDCYETYPVITQTYL